MITLHEPPAFASPEEFAARRGDLDFWWPYVADVLRRHGLLDSRLEPVSGFNVTHPTFIYGDAVVKLFGYAPITWPKCHAAEAAAYRLIAKDPEIAAPRLLGEGHLYSGRGDRWPYLITTRMPGIATWRADLNRDQKISQAIELGKQVQRLHALPRGTVETASERDWPARDVVTAAERSSLPPHLIAQIDDYLARLGPPDHVFVNSDIVANHVHVDDGNFTGIIDWGDAMTTDRHVELIQIYRDTFECDNALLRVFLEASVWPVDENFPRQAMGHALRRQAIGLVQHDTIDVFMPIAEKFPLEDIATLDELATELFGI